MVSLIAMPSAKSATISQTISRICLSKNNVLFDFKFDMKIEIQWVKIVSFLGLYNNFSL